MDKEKSEALADKSTNEGEREKVEGIDEEKVKDAFESMEEGERENETEVEGNDVVVESMEEGQQENVEERKEKKTKPQSEDGSNTEFQNQVTAFRTRGELGQYASKQNLVRTPLADLKPNSTLSDTYAGGKVITAFSGELTQGRVVLLLQDNPRSNRYIQCVVTGDVTRLLPHSAQLGMSEVYVHGALVGQTMAESSQEMEMEIRVDGEEGKIWIVNREAKSNRFLPARQPSEFQGRGGNGKKARRQRHMEAGLERERREKAAGVSNTQSGDPRVVPPTNSSNSPSVSVDPRLSGRLTPSEASHYATGPEPPPSVVPSSSCPDHHNVPDAVVTAQESHDNQSGSDREMRNDEDSSSDESSSEGEDECGGQARRTGSSGRQYTYKRVAHLEAGMQRVNVFGVVTDFKQPFQTKGRDYGSIVNIIDESVTGEPLKCTFFNSNQEKLPKITKVGQIVCLHRINIKLFPSGIQGVGQPFSSSLCFSGKLGTKVKPSTGSLSYTFTAQDKLRVKELRLWNAIRCKTKNPLAGALKDIQPGAAIDMVCQVVSVSLKEPQAEGSSAEQDIAVLGVRDGTHLPHRSLKLNLSAFNPATDPHFQNMKELTEHVVVYGKELVEAAATLSSGQFVCLQNLQAKVHTQYNSFKDVCTAVELRMQPSQPSQGNVRETSIKTLTSHDIEVFELKMSLRNCQREPIQFRPLPPDIKPSGITHTPHSQQQPLPLSALANQMQIPAKFRCIVKVLGIKPESVEDMVRLRCSICKHKVAVTSTATAKRNTPCPKCAPKKRKQKQKMPILQPVYFFKLKLADETGDIVAYVTGRQASNFLSGSPPLVFFQYPEQRMSLLDQLYRLTGGNDPFNEDSVSFARPWLEVCLVCMNHSESQVSSLNQQNVTYHLFDTVIQTS